MPFGAVWCFNMYSRWLFPQQCVHPCSSPEPRPNGETATLPVSSCIYRVKIPEMDYQAEVRVCLQCHESRLKKKTSKWQRILDEFEIMNMVGAGGIGKVYKVMQKTSKRVFAMKVIEKKSIRSEHCALGVGAEKFVLSKIQHPFIIRLHHTFQTHDKLFFVMDFMPRGDLFHLMTTVRIPEAAVKLFLAQIGMALNYLHESGWIYRCACVCVRWAGADIRRQLREHTGLVPQFWDPHVGWLRMMHGRVRLGQQHDHKGCVQTMWHVGRSLAWTRPSLFCVWTYQRDMVPTAALMEPMS